VQFKITYADGSYLLDEGGKLSSNGLYWTNEEGQIVLSGINGTVVVTEVESIPGYTIDPDTQSQTVVVNPDDTQQLYFYNAPVGGVELIKVNEADKTERIPNTTFEIRRVSDDTLVDTVTTGKNGRSVPPSGEWRLLRRGDRGRGWIQAGRYAHLFYRQGRRDHPQNSDQQGVFRHPHP